LTLMGNEERKHRRGPRFFFFFARATNTNTLRAPYPAWRSISQRSRFNNSQVSLCKCGIYIECECRVNIGFLHAARSGGSEERCTRFKLAAPRPSSATGINKKQTKTRPRAPPPHTTTHTFHPRLQQMLDNYSAITLSSLSQAPLCIHSGGGGRRVSSRGGGI